MQRFIKSIGWLLISGVCLALTPWVLAEQPVKIEPAGESAWRLTTTLMGPADRIDWAAEDAMSGSFQVDRSSLEWTNHPGYVEIRWVVRSEAPLEPMTGSLVRSFEDQTEAVRVNIDTALDVMGPIQSGMTLWGIANGWLDGWDEVAIHVGESGEGQRPRPTIPEWMDQIMRANPQAFETNEASSLMRGAMLRHPIERRLTTPTQPVESLPEQADQTAVIESELSQPSASAPFLNDSLEPDVFESDSFESEQTNQEPMRHESSGSAPSHTESSNTETSSTETSNTETSNTETSNIDPVGSRPSVMDFGFLDQPDWWRQEREMGRVAFVSGLVVVCLLMLHGWSKVGGTGWPDERTQTLGTFDTDSPTMTPEAVTMTLDLAERYLAMGDAAQALHWLEEVIAHGTPKEVRHAKRLWRQALALIHGLSEPGSTAGEMSEPTTHRLAAAIEYDGTPFFGWQRQRQTPTVQECLENALSKVADHTVQVHASGRTDTGVHAWRQVVHFDVGVERSERSWILGTQTHLHPGVSMVWVKPVAPDFHARYSASSRHYCYRIINRIHRPAIDRQRAAWVHQPLDAQSMHEAAQVLVGEHDFSSFRAAGCQSKRATRAVHWVSVERDGDEIAIHIQANSFLYHMVRNITGSLMLVGRGERSVAWLAEVLAQKDRTQSGMTAPAHGLYFMRSVYPIYLGLPDEVSKPNQ